MKLTVITSNPSNEGKSFVTKLSAKKTVDLGVLGVKESNITYYISTPKQAPVNTTIELDITLFNITEHPFEHPETGETIQLKWLHIK